MVLEAAQSSTKGSATADPMSLDPWSDITHQADPSIMPSPHDAGQ